MPTRIGWVKIHSQTDLINAGGYLESEHCQQALAEITDTISGMEWPQGSGSFTIYAQSGKKRGEGNGVVPIKQMFIGGLEKRGWTSEVTFPMQEGQPKDGAKFGAMDAAKTFGAGGAPFMVEWETGNISSSHRAVNKIALGVMTGTVAGGVLVVPTHSFAKFLTDRIGNLRELVPYFPLWSSIQATHGYLGIIAVEHDHASLKVDRFTKGTDGRSLA